MPQRRYWILTTILAHVVEEKLPYKISTFTASFPGNQVDETAFIKLLKRHYEFSDFYTYPDFNKLWKVANSFLWHQELPVQSTSMFAQWEVMRLANENSIKVLLDGQGMDEILGGYSEFAGSLLLGHLANGRFLKFIKAYKDLKTNYTTSPVLNELSRAMFHYLPEILRRQNLFISTYWSFNNKQKIYLISFDKLNLKEEFRIPLEKHHSLASRTYCQYYCAMKTGAVWHSRLNQGCHILTTVS